jgi:hypothetical protein
LAEESHRLVRAALALTSDPGSLEDAVYEAIRAFDEQENGVRFIENMLTE